MKQEVTRQKPRMGQTSPRCDRIKNEYAKYDNNNNHVAVILGSYLVDITLHYMNFADAFVQSD